MSIGTKKLVHIAFVVRDLDKVVDAWTKILGIERPRIWNIPGPDVAPVLTNGHPEIYTNCRISVIHNQGSMRNRWILSYRLLSRSELFIC